MFLVLVQLVTLLEPEKTPSLQKTVSANHLSEAEQSAMALGLLVLVNSNESVSSFGTLVDSEEPNTMRFTEAEARLLRWSWNENIGHVDLSDDKASISEAFSLLQFWDEIYSYVNIMDEELRRILPPPSHQTGYFTGIVRMAVISAGDLTVMNDYLRSIGRRHGILFGAEPAYFQTLGIAIIRALNDRFGEDFTPQLEHVWILLYCYISNAMIESCSVHPVFPEDVSVGLVTISEAAPKNEELKLKKKKSVFNPANMSPGYVHPLRARMI